MSKCVKNIRYFNNSFNAVLFIMNKYKGKNVALLSRTRYGYNGGKTIYIDVYGKDFNCGRWYSIYEHSDGKADISVWCDKEFYANTADIFRCATEMRTVLYDNLSR